MTPNQSLTQPSVVSGDNPQPTAPQSLEQNQTISSRQENRRAATDGAPTDGAATDGEGQSREPDGKAQATPARLSPAPPLLASIIVPVFNGAAVIERCLDALARQTLDTDSWEVIVIADGSTDETPAVVESWMGAQPQVHARLIVQTNAGPAAARNRGAELAHAPILLFTDADCAPEPDWAARLLAVFDESDVVGAKGVYLSDQTGLVPRFVQAEYEDRYDRMADLSQIDTIDTYAAAYRRDVFLDNGGFDPTFVKAACEDHDLSFRLAQRGYRMVFAPEVKVRHLHVETIGGYLRRKYHVGFWKSLLTHRHPQRIVYDTHTPQTLKVQILLSGLIAGSLPLALLSFLFPALSFVWWIIAGALVVFYLSAGGFLHKLWARSPALAGMGLVMLQARALASGTGYLMGTFHFASIRN